MQSLTTRTMAKRALAAAAAAWIVAGPTHAATVNIPPVVISALNHSITHPVFGPLRTSISDGVTFSSGVGYSGPGFTASIGTGDNVVVRFEAPAGMRFSVLPVSGAASHTFTISGNWSAGPDSFSFIETPSVCFENFEGEFPTLTQSFSSIADSGMAVDVRRIYDITNPFTFTAVRIQFSVLQHAVASVPRTYGSIGSGGTPSFGVTARFPSEFEPDRTLMTLEAIPAAGACCNGASCAVTSPAACTGTFVGAGSTCAPLVRGGAINACCRSDFNNSGTISVQDIFDFLAAYFGGCP